MLETDRLNHLFKKIYLQSLRCYKTKGFFPLWSLNTWSCNDSFLLEHYKKYNFGKMAVVLKVKLLVIVGLKLVKLMAKQTRF